MATLPQLIEEDIRQIDEVLLDFVRQANLIGALLVDKGGFLITNKGDTGDLDLTTIGALASGAFMATQTIAGLVNEKNFNSTFQQGEKFSLYILEVDDECLMVIIFSTESGLGVVKYYSTNVATAIARQVNLARERNPGGGFDLSVLNLSNTKELFRKKS
jgi:predicted regulator of Ras-like GTPase activity (Roadblock/LC7/MglB family)